MAERKTYFVRGTIYWCKLLGNPRPNYDGDAKEWTVDFVPDDVTFLKENRLLDRLKEGKTPIEGDYVRLRKSELTKDGEKNEPVRIYDAENEAWDASKLIGNGSKADAKIQVVDWGPGKKKSIYLQAIRITDLVAFVSNEFGAMDGDNEAPKKETKPKGKAQKTVLEEMDDLDDDLPFD